MTSKKFVVCNIELIDFTIEDITNVLCRKVFKLQRKLVKNNLLAAKYFS